MPLAVCLTARGPVPGYAGRAATVALPDGCCQSCVRQSRHFIGLAASALVPYRPRRKS